MALCRGKWEYSFLMTELYSHPNVPLIRHLQEVAVSCQNILASKQLSLGISSELIEEIGYLMGATHDIGKATSFFQHYLTSENHEVLGPKHHALLSAFYCKMMVDQLFNRNDNVSEIDRMLLPYLIFVAVKRHHGNLLNVEDELGKLAERSGDLLQQIKVIDANQIEPLLDKVLAQVNLGNQWSSFCEWIKDQKFPDDYGYFYLDFFELGPFVEMAEQEKSRYFYLFQLFYSTLLLADKRDVILESRPQFRPLETHAVENYRIKKGFDQPKTSLATLQNEAYISSLAHLTEIFSVDQHLYSLTLPTGMGKTITSLSVVLRLQQLLSLPDSRIIIAIPFTSIIDQNYLVYKEVFQARTSDQLLKHHHLSEPNYKLQEDELDAGQSQFLIETWDSQVVVTTFVQLLESLFTNNKTKLLKLPQLANSVVILDEVQSIPYSLWPLIRTGIRQIAAMYNTYFVFLSATQPLIFQPGEEIIEIVPGYKKYFQNNLFNRTKLINRIKEEVSLDEFVDEVVTYAVSYSQKDILIVLNTKKITRECFLKIRELIDEGSELLYLSTLITPFERKKIIQRIKDRPHSKRFIIVSTQLIEAGVDISVDAVFRALAPMDSIIQAAGRANRYNEKTVPADIFVYGITELKQVSSRIYGAELLQMTRNVLSDVSEQEECGYLTLIEAYFQEVKKQADVVSNTTLTSLLDLKFEDVGEFNLIEEIRSNSVFIQLNPRAKEAWEKFTIIHENEDLLFYEKKYRFAEFKSTFYDFVINVPIPFGEESIDFDRAPALGFYVSELEQPSAYYTYSEDDFSRNIGYEKLSQVSF